MSYELFVYHKAPSVPSTEDISELVGAAGWRCALVDSLESLKPTTLTDSAIALGWETGGDSEELIADAIAGGNPASIGRFPEDLSVVDITTEHPFKPDPEAIEEMRSGGIKPDLVARVQQATSQFGFRTVSASDLAIEFQWAIAGAVGVMVDGVLEDLEEGTLIDCTEDDE